jgi:Rad3-related DNA helicase
MSELLPPPIVFNLPKKFCYWRPYQAQATESQTESDPRFLLQVCPTGFGKSIVYMTSAKLITGRTIILTSTKGLQSQLKSDFGSMPVVVEIRGRGNYPCRLNTKLNCDHRMNTPMGLVSLIC